MIHIQIQRIVDWLEHCAAESMENEFMKDAKHFSDEEVAWPNTLGQLLVYIWVPGDEFTIGHLLFKKYYINVLENIYLI